MLDMNRLKVGTVISYEGAPYVVTFSQHVQMGRGSAVLRTKLRNLLSGAVLERTFKHGDKIGEADLVRTRVNFLYRDEGQLHFMDTKSFEQFSFSQGQLGNTANFCKESSDVDVMYFEGKPVSIELPKKIAFQVTQTEPAVRGNTAQGNVMKPATLETGYVVQVPIFIQEGDTVIVNTDTGTYVERG